MTGHLRLDAVGVDVAYTAGGGAQATSAVRDLNLQLHRGEWRGILGESGSGKSTLALSLLGLLTDARVRGRACLDGTDLFDLHEEQWQAVRWTQVALAFQPTTSLNPALRVDAQVAEPLVVHRGMKDREARSQAGDLLERVGLARAQHRSYPAQLSTGQKRLVLLAAALSCDPTLLLLDEPTAGLDPLTRVQVLEMLGELRVERPEMTVVLMGHDIDALRRTEIDTVQVLYMGAAVELGSAVDVLDHPSHPYTRGLLNASPTLRTIKDLRAIRGTSPEMGTVLSGCSFAARCTQAIPVCSEVTQRLEVVRSAPGQEAASAGNGPVHARVIVPHEVACARGGVVTVLQARGLTHAYRSGLAGRVAVLDDVDIELRSGEVLGLVGMTGAGKTTLSLILAGLLRPDGGHVVVDGVTSTDKDAVHHRVQMVFQDPYEAVSARFTVEEAVREPLDIAKVGSLDERAEKVRTVLAKVNLSPTPALLRRRAHLLSGGQLQRVALARALVVDPAVLLADEPVALLDPSEQARVLQLLKELQVERGLSMIFVSHSLPLVLRVADTVAVLAGGKIVEQGPGEQLLERPRSLEAASLLEAAGWIFQSPLRGGEAAGGSDLPTQAFPDAVLDRAPRAVSVPRVAGRGRLAPGAPSRRRMRWQPLQVITDRGPSRDVDEQRPRALEKGPGA